MNPNSIENNCDLENNLWASLEWLFPFFYVAFAQCLYWWYFFSAISSFFYSKWACCSQFFASNINMYTNNNRVLAIIFISMFSHGMFCNENKMSTFRLMISTTQCIIGILWWIFPCFYFDISCKNEIFDVTCGMYCIRVYIVHKCIWNIERFAYTAQNSKTNKSMFGTFKTLCYIDDFIAQNTQTFFPDIFLQAAISS